MIGAALVAALALASQLQTHPTGLPSVGPSRGNSLRTAPIMDKLYEQAGKPALDFDFARYKDLHDNASGKTSLVNFSRSAAQSPGTYVGADGLVHDAAVNLQVYSEQFDSATWVKLSSTIAANQIVSPDGKQTADKFTLNANGISASILDGFASTANTSYTASVYAKAGTADNVSVYIVDQGTVSAYCDFDLTNGTIGTPSATTGQTIESVGDGWYRISISYVFPAAGAADTFYIRGGPAALSGENFYIWGAQLEETDAATMAPTAYIHTTSQALAAPRFDHTPTTGNLTTNLLTYSEMFDRWSPTRTVVLPNVETDPLNGEQVADKLREDFTPTSSHFINSIASDFVSGTTYTFSIYAKSAERTQVGFNMSGSVAGATPAIFDLSAGTVVTDGSFASTNMQNIGNGWYRCSGTITATGTASAGVIVRLAVGGSTSYSGDGSSGVYLYGAQLEASPAPGPYVRTLSETRSISDANAESLGLLVEEARTNLVWPSEDFTSAARWPKASITVNSTTEIAPDGSATATRMTSTGNAFMYQSLGLASQMWTTSIWIKSNNLSSIKLGTNAGQQDVSVTSDWTRVSVSAVGNTWFIIGSGSSFPSGAEIYIWGAQLEDASFPTSYIPTTGTSQYRYADVAAVQDEDFSTTNLLAYSESFDVGWSNFRFVATPNATTAPNGQTTADALTQQTGQTLAAISRQTISYGQATLSVFAKPNGKNWLIVSSGSQSANFNIATGEIGTGSISTAFIESAGNGWYRVGATFPSGTYAWFEHRDNPLTNVVTDSGGVYLWGASLTATEYPVEYVTTRNLLTDSQDFERSSWIKESSITLANDVSQAPDGTLTADSATWATINRSLYHGFTTVSGKDYVASIYLKGTAGETIEVQLDGAGGVFDRRTHTLTGNWDRVERMITTVGTSGNFGIRKEAASTASTVLVWGGQFEPGTTATDYVRTVDVVGKSYNWYEPTEGTVFVDVAPAYDGAQTASVVVFNTTTYQESNVIFKANQTNTGDGLRWVAQTFDGATQATLPTPTDIADVEAKLAYGYKHNDFGFGAEGSLIGPDLTGTTPNPSQMYFMNRAGTYHLNGHIKRLSYWPRRQADSTLQVITQ